ncbi:MAG: twin-arginine translocase TatA/TatE family subunit [Anaerolineales bacterium]
MLLKGFGLPELLIILVIVILLFGVGRIGKIAKELGSGIRSFKDGIEGKDKDEGEKEKEKIEV